MKAIKENKVYKINEQLKQRYLNEGFDICDDNGDIIEHSPKKLIKYSDHLKKLVEVESKMTADNVTSLLKSYAEFNKIDLGSATAAKGMLDKILEAEKTDIQEEKA